MKYICKHCGWIYDEGNGLPEADIESDTLWEDIQEDFECPVCWAEKGQFSAVSE